MRTLTLALVAALAMACGHSASPIAPSVPDVPTAIVITYAINIPIPLTASQLQQQYPTGVAVSPIEAQGVWNYTCEYEGAPSVYYGPTAPPTGVYRGVGILSAPGNAAAHETFTGSDWPAINIGYAPSQPYRWTGLFTYAQPWAGLPAYGVCPH